MIIGSPLQTGTSKGKTLRRNVSLTDMRSPHFGSNIRDIATLFAERVTLAPHEHLFRHSDPCTAVFFIARGIVYISPWIAASKHHKRNSFFGRVSGASHEDVNINDAEDHVAFSPPVGGRCSEEPRSSTSSRRRGPDVRRSSLQKLLQSYGRDPVTGAPAGAAGARKWSPGGTAARSACRPGAVLGNTAFAYPKIGMGYGFDAWGGDKECVLFKISRHSLRQMEVARPHLAVLLQKVFLQEICFDAMRELEVGDVVSM